MADLLPLSPPERPAPAAIAIVMTATQTMRVRMRFGRRTSVRASVTVTPAGLLAVGGLIAAVLLSVVPIVHAAGEAGRRD